MCASDSYLSLFQTRNVLALSVKRSFNISTTFLMAEVGVALEVGEEVLEDSFPDVSIEISDIILVEIVDVLHAWMDIL